MSLLDIPLPEPSFVARDPAAITADIIAQYESLTGKTLYPAQIERVLIDIIAYRESLLRVALQDAAMQCLVRYARAPMLDMLGEGVGTPRLTGETDEAYRVRIVLAPAQFSVAGSIGAYRFFARTAHPDIIDVAVESPIAGTVDLHPLVRTVDANGIATIGLPSAAVLAAVLSACSAELVRPLCDTVAVLPPVQVNYAIRAELTLYANADPVATLAAVNRAIAAYQARMTSTLGNDIVRNQLIQLLQGYGVYNVNLIQPAADRILAADEWANCTSSLISVVGTQVG